MSEGTNPNMNTKMKAGSAGISFSNISDCYEGTSSEGTSSDSEWDNDRISSHLTNHNQQNVVKMKIFMETWCRFIDSRAKHNAGQESFEIRRLDLTIEELSDRLNSISDDLRTSKSRIQLAWEHFPYKGYLAFIYLVVLMLLSFFTLLYGVWWVGLVGLLGGSLSIYLFTSSRTHSTRFKKDWIYTFYLKLRLKLWKIPPPAPDNDMLNPKCIYVPLNKHQADTCGEWLSAVILPTLQSELRITDMKGLDSTIKNAEYSLNDFQKYSLWVDGVMGPLGNVPLWCFWLLCVVGLIILTIGALYHESGIVKVVSLSGVTCTCLIKIIYEFIKSNKENVEPDIEANVNIFDVICRLHRVIKKETIFFAVVANELDDFNVIPMEYQKYFKFLISCDDGIHEQYVNYLFDMDMLRYIEINDSVTYSLADIIFHYIINKKFITEPGEVENTFKFLRLLHKINNDNNNVLTNRSMLHLVDGIATVSFFQRDPEAICLRLSFDYNGSNLSARISHLDLQAMGLYTTQYKLMIERLKNKGGTGSSMIVRFWNNEKKPIVFRDNDLINIFRDNIILSE